MRFIVAVLMASCFVVRADDAKQLAAKCGYEIKWQKNYGAAVDEAKKTGRLIFMYVYDRQQSTMFGNSFKDDFMMCGPFMDPDVVNLINRKFVPVRVKMDSDLAEKLNIRLAQVVVPGLLFVDAKDRVAFKFDRIATASEELIFYACRTVLDKNKEYDKPSDQTAVLETGDDAGSRFRLGLSLLKDGEFVKAVETFKGVIKKFPDSDEAIESYYRASTAYRRLRRVKEAAQAIAKVRELDKEDRLKLYGDLMVEEALLLIKQGKFEEALKILKTAGEKYPKCTRSSEGLYYLGVLYYYADDESKAKELWKALVQDKAQHRWAWKAAANLVDRGPLTNGWEVLEWLPEDVLKGDPSSTERKRKPEEFDEVVRQGCEYILRHQHANGSWTNVKGQFDFKEAITALCCMTLMECSDIQPEQNKAARMRALDYLEKWYEKKPKADGMTLWAHIYNLLLDVRLYRGADAEAKKGYLERINWFMGAIKKVQNKDGSWSYVGFAPTSFITAAALVVLWETKESGIEVDQKMVEEGLKGMMLMKVVEDGEDEDKDAYEYTNDTSSQFKTGKFEGSAGRMAPCYLAEYLWKKCDQKKLEWALSKFIEHRSRLKRVRKSTDWHSGNYANAPYFFMFDYWHAAQAMTRLTADKRKEYLAQVRDDILEINEIDGSWLDWHIGGKNYGAAMGVLILRDCGRYLHHKDQNY